MGCGVAAGWRGLRRFGAEFWGDLGVHEGHEGRGGGRNGVRGWRVSGNDGEWGDGGGVAVLELLLDRPSTLCLN